MVGDRVGDWKRAVVALSAGALLLGACGGGGDDADEGEASTDGTEAAESAGAAPAEVTVETLQAVGDASAAAEQYAFDIDMTFTGLSAIPVLPEGTPDEATMGIAGAVDSPGGRAEVELDVGEVAGLAGDAPDGDAVITALVDGDSAWVNYGGLSQSQGVEPTQWVSVAVDQLAQSVAVGPTGNAGGSTSLASLGDLLQGVDSDEDISVQGEEEVDGVPVAHVIANVDVAQALEATPEERRAALESQLTGITELPLHLWVGGDDLPRRVEIILEPAEGGTAPGMRVVADLSAYGEPVEITPPEEGSVVEQPAGGASPSSTGG